MALNISKHLKSETPQIISGESSSGSSGGLNISKHISQRGIDRMEQYVSDQEESMEQEDKGFFQKWFGVGEEGMGKAGEVVEDLRGFGDKVNNYAKQEQQKRKEEQYAREIGNALFMETGEGMEKEIIVPPGPTIEILEAERKYPAGTKITGKIGGGTTPFEAAYTEVKKEPTVPIEPGIVEMIEERPQEISIIPASARRIISFGLDTLGQDGYYAKTKGLQWLVGEDEILPQSVRTAMAFESTSEKMDEYVGRIGEKEGYHPLSLPLVILGQSIMAGVESIPAITPGVVSTKIAKQIEKGAAKTIAKNGDITTKELGDITNKVLVENGITDPKTVENVVQKISDTNEKTLKKAAELAKDEKKLAQAQMDLETKATTKADDVKPKAAPLITEAKKYKSADEFVEAYTAKHLMDLSDPKKHRFGRLFDETGEGIQDTFDIVKQYGDDIKYYPDSKIPLVKSGDEMVEIYRGTSKKQKDLLPGDFVSFSDEYAKSHNVDGHLISKKVPAKDVIWQGNDFNEWVYSPAKIRKQYPGGLEDIYKQATKADVPKKPIAKAVPETKVVKPIKEVPKEESISKVAKSIEAKSIEKKFVDEGFEELADYTKITIKDQAEKVAKLINDDIDKVRSIVAGNTPLPKDVRGAALIKGVEEYAMKTGDVKLLNELANSHLVSETSKHAQELRLLAEREPDSVTAKLREITTARKKAFEKKGAKIKESVKSEIKNIKSKIKTPTKQDWQSFVNEIKC